MENNHYFKKIFNAKGVSLFILTWVLLACNSDKKREVYKTNNSQKITKNMIQSIIDSSIEQYKYLSNGVPANRLPKSYYTKNDSLALSNTSWWTSGFYPGTLLYLFELSGDSIMYELAKEKLNILKVEKNNTSTHDLGFMLYCSFGNAIRLNENKHYSQIMLKGAESLASRFYSEVGLIKSWDFGKWNYPVIIDNMLNLEFLLWASKESGNPKFKNIALTHANNTIKNHFRKDYSTYHVIDYDSLTGQVIAKKTHQGKSDNSAWSRGQAWGLYGFTVMYRETYNQEYLHQAKKIAEFILSNPNMPEDCIPYWDFNASASKSTYRDASAAAVNASALLELSKHVKDPKLKERYKTSAEKIIVNLSTSKYLASPKTNGGFILKHSVGSLPHNSEIDVPLTYADYYYIEAVKRYKDWFLTEDAN